jgi:hypothetical protein
VCGGVWGCGCGGGGGGGGGAVLVVDLSTACVAAFASRETQMHGLGLGALQTGDSVCE